jgi:hypothetical protein
MRRRSVSVAVFVLASSCGTSSHPVAPEKQLGTSIEVADLEINGDGIDRFAACPPPGDLGQEWYPAVADWSPPPGSPQPENSGTPQPQSTEQLGRTPTERAVEDTRAQFRSCYHRGLVHDPTQFGHVAVVLRVGPNGRVLKTESWGACELQHDVIACMRDVGKAYRFDPPAGGKDTVIIPVVFQPRNGAGAMSTQNDAYTAQAYVNLESMRPQLHECETRARQSGKDVEAWAVFDMAIDKNGQVTSANIDPYHGDQEILACAAEVMQKMRLPPPDGGKGKLLARITFNPRAGTR